MLVHKLMASISKPATVADPVILIHADSSLIDNSPNGFALSSIGGASISSTQAKFGGGSIYFQYPDRGVQLPAEPKLTLTGDFTLDCWIYATSSSLGMVIFGSDYGAGTNHQIQINTQVTSTPTPGLFGIYHPTTGWLTAQGSVISSTWTHYAVTRSGSTVRFFINGALVGSVSSSVSYNFSNGAIGALRGYLQGGVQGYMDEVRIVSGVAKWTSAFTPPTSPY